MEDSIKMKINDFLVSVRSKFLLLKIYISRTTTYLSIINSGMILFLFLISLKERGIINFELDNYFFIIFFTGLFLMIVIGWIEITFLKGFQEECKLSFYYQQPLVDMKDKIDLIYNCLKVNKI